MRGLIRDFPFLEGVGVAWLEKEFLHLAKKVHLAVGLRIDFCAFDGMHDGGCILIFIR